MSAKRVVDQDRTRISCARAAIVLALVLTPSCAADSPRDHAKVGTATEALNQAGHTGGAVNAFNDPTFKRGLLAFDELYWYMDPREAADWANDPDCPNDDCGAVLTGPIPSGENLSDGKIAFAKAMCWAMRNPDHFPSNPNGAWATTTIGSAPTAADLVDWDTRNRKMHDWVPRDTGAAVAALMPAALGVVDGIATKDDGYARARTGLRAAFNACHYAMDSLACGHKTGNVWCNPYDATPSSDCQHFIDYNLSNRGVMNAAADPEDNLVVETSIGVAFSSYCNTAAGLTYPMPFSRGLQYAAAERYIRHHTTSGVCDGADQYPLNPGTSYESWVAGKWGANKAYSAPHGESLSWNDCNPGCPGGECVVGSATPSTGTEPAVVSSCVNLVKSVRDELDKNPRFFMSPSYGLNAARSCRAVSNRTTCEWVTRYRGGGCNAEEQCVVDSNSADGYPITSVVGTCREGVSFGGALPPSCVNDSTTTPATPRCVSRCTAANGWIDGNGHCMKSDYSTGNDQDLTPWACREAPPGATKDCEPLANADMCKALGGTCRLDGACIDAAHLDVAASATDSVVIGTCSPTAPSFDGQYANPCPNPTASSTISYGGPLCNEKGGECSSDYDCCGGRCVGALDSWALTESGVPQIMVCKDIPSYDWLFVDVDGWLGSDSINVSSSTSCNGVCARSFTDGTTVTMSLASGKPAKWYGCDSTSGASCTVSIAKTRNVQLSLPPCSSAICTPGGACAAGSGSLGEMGSGCTLKGSFPSFSDASGTDITDAAYLGWMSPCGYESWGAPKFCPNDSVSRGEMATILVRAMFGETFSLIQATTPYFTDVPMSDWRFKYIQKLSEIGLTHGYGGGLFGPNDPMTREQMAAFLVRLWSYRNYGSPESFTACAAPFFNDEPQPAGWSPYSSTHTMFDYVQKLRELGITVGVSVDPPLYSPGSYVTRSQMASFILREVGPSAMPGYVSLASPASCLANNQMIVTGATYGGNCGAPTGNATVPTATACDRKTGTCAYPVSVSALGDPAPGCYKSYTVDYRCGATQHSTVTLGGSGSDANGQTALLSCP